MDISKISVSGIEYDVKDEYARKNMGVKEEDVVGIVDDYVAKNKEQLKGDKGEKGDKGDQGVRGEKGEKGDSGADGKDGANGVSPQRGTDYWTSSDKEEILSECKSYIDSEILGGES